MVEALLGVVIGILLTLVVGALAYLIINKNKSFIVRKVAKVERAVAPLVKEKVAIIRSMESPEEQVKEMLKGAKHRGGIPDSELR